MHIVNRARLGFTLIELVIVIGIIGIVLAIMSVPLTGIQSRGRDDRRKLDIKELQVAIAQSHANQPGGFYPITITNLVTEKYLEKLPLDPTTKTSAPYRYIPLPIDCNNSSMYCTAYRISIDLENGNVYLVTSNNPQGSMLSPTPSTMSLPTITHSITPTITHTVTPTITHPIIPTIVHNNWNNPAPDPIFPTAYEEAAF